MSALGRLSWVWGRGREVAQRWCVWAQRAGEAAGILWLGAGGGLELLGYFRAGGAESSSSALWQWFLMLGWHDIPSLPSSQVGLGQRTPG